MAEAFIVGAIRTAGGRKNGRLSKVHPADLGGKVLDGLMAQVKLDPALVEDVVFGCVSQSGAQAGNIGRSAVLSSAFPESVPGTSVDRQCGSGQQAIHFAVQGVLSGTQDLVIGGGVENMSMVPIGSNIIDGLKAGHGQPWNSERMSARYPGVKFSQFAGAELLAKQHGLTREELDRFAYESHMRAAHATKEGRFKGQILPLQVQTEDGKPLVHDGDEGIRADAQYEKIHALQALVPGGLITAGTSSQICDGAAAVLIASERAVKEHKLTPRARIHTLSVVGSDPVVML
ncbi:MAG TPA: acetyl-CoA C-acyltransferase, partial [Polyangiales bacterium]